MTARAQSSWCRRGDHISCGQVVAVCACSCHEVMAPKNQPGPKPGTVDRAKASAAANRARKAKAPAYQTVRLAVPKEAAPCYTSRRDNLGRLPIGFCSKGCIRRPVTVRS